MRAFGAASSNLHIPPVWSRSGWVIQIQRTSAGSTTLARSDTKSLSDVLSPVSTTTGCSAWRTKVLTGRNPMPGTSVLSLITVTSGLILWIFMMFSPFGRVVGFRRARAW